MSRASSHFRALLLAAFAALPAFAGAQPAFVQSVKVAPADGGATIEVVSSKPLTPELQTVENPLRLVIDLPGSTLSTARKRIPFRN